MSKTDGYDLRASSSFPCGVLESLECRLLLAGTPPLAVDDAAQTEEMVPVSIDVLANDNDVDGDINRSTLAIHTDPANGSAFVDPAYNTIEYTPNTFFVGDDTFSYTVEDSQGNMSNVATVTVRVGNTPPTANDSSETTTRDVLFSSSVSGDDADNDPLSFARDSGPLHGALDFNTDGTYTYTPMSGWTGADSFTFTAFDGQDYSAPATVTIDVLPPDLALEFDAANWASFRNARGDVVRVGMEGPGCGVAYVTSLTEGDITNIDLTGTDLSSSLLVLTSSPAGATTLGGLAADCDLRRVYAPRINLAGPVDIQGQLGSLTMHDVLGPAMLTAMGGAGGTSLYLDDVRDLSVEVVGRLGVVRAQRWINTDEQSDVLKAYALARLLITGSTGRELAGDFEADLALGQQQVLLAGFSESIPSSSLVQALGVALVQGEVRDAVWEIAGRVGQILINGHAARWDLIVGGALQMAVVMGPLMNVQMMVGGLLGTLRSGGWFNTTLEAGQANSLQVLGHMGNSSVTVNGPVQSGWRALGQALVSGQIHSCTWTVGGSAGSIRAGDVTDWSLYVNGGLADLGVGAVSNSYVDVVGLLVRGFTGSWDGGALRAFRAGIIHVAGDLQANVGVGVSSGKTSEEGFSLTSEISTSSVSRVLNILAVCGTIRNANVWVNGSAGLIHARSLIGSSILVGAYAAGGSSEDFYLPAVLDLLVLGHPAGGQSVMNSEVSAHTILGVYLVGRPDISGLTVQYHFNPFVMPRRLTSVDWVQV